MIIEVKSTQEFIDKVTTFSPRWLSVKNSSGNAYITYNRKLSEVKSKIAEIVKILNSSQTPDDVYFIDARQSRQKIGVIYKYIKGSPEITNFQPLAEKTIETMKNEQDIITNSELLELRVSLERYKIENEILQSSLDDLEASLEDSEALSSAPPPNQWKELISSAMPAIDAIVGVWKTSIEVKQAEMIYRQQQQYIQPPPPNQQTQQNKKIELSEITLEMVENMKNSSPSDFFQWINVEENSIHYNNLKNTQNNGL